ncbi:ketoacyl-synt-domain-containing protein [Pseudovirgaria hyperparasitica]|uniref:Ketoacyl-synt-domain-containing protein n=1 Tax=Pseudovirgaria hyperparasitica TaxID=470096 RepID=A0A6A6W5L6_9PEZI|nr:ketoacyl-synt-domain-containing protein [Pseudovirgaria hyperparasitica]KAF2758172.1 ketoacyl-synt-domain-containing protein [Pseudovirgaria hyperparasitica]
MNIILFGDQTADQYSLLRRICSKRDNALLSSFLERVAVVLREEAHILPRWQRCLIPDFLTVGHLVEAYYENGMKIPQLESCMVTISQLGHYIGYYGEHPTELPTATNRRILGLCTGLFAAVAVASAPALSDLLPLAVEAVRIAFRTGTCVSTVKNALEQNSETRESWSTIVAGISESNARKAISDFHGRNSVSASNQAYISAVSTMAMTISGPPSIRKRLFEESEAFSKTNRVNIPVYAPYHASHLYSSTDVLKILDCPGRQTLQKSRPHSLFHSAATGICHSTSNTMELMEIALTEVLREPVRWDHLLQEVVSEAISTGSQECSLFAVGMTNITNSLASALKAGGIPTVTVVDHLNWTSAEHSHGRTQNDKIAIVGMAGRFPNAASHEQLWELLEKGLDVHREIPSDRFDAQAHYDPSGKGKNKSHTKFGCFIDEPGLFDPRFFNMSPREAAQTDPMGRLALTTAYEALEMSGYVPNRTPSTKVHRIGTFYGQTSDDWREINASENVDTYFITGGVRAFAPGRINYYFKFSGPSYSVDTACSSSLAAIQLACTSLWAGDCDTACAGGLNVLTNPDIFSGLSKGQFLSKTGSCKTYDNDADGYCRGDGCGTVILKRYEDAVADKDNILGCILGAATNHSAEAVSITHPHAGAQEFLYKRVLANAGVDAHEISYVEMHGTGTQAGDGIEMTSVTNAFAPRHRQRLPHETLHLGAIKANIGHGEAASGINSLIKVMMMFQKNVIPANVGIKGVMNKTFPKDLLQRNVHIETKQVAFPRHGAEKRKIFLNNFSAAGGNTAIVLEDGPLQKAPTVDDPRSSHVVTVTARSIASLKRNIENLTKYLVDNPTTTLPSLSYTTTARRIQHNYRVAFTSSAITTAQDNLRAQLKDSYSPAAMAPTKVAFTFTGQGSQYTAMGQKLYKDLPSYRAEIDQLDGLARLQGFPSFLPLIDGADVKTLSPVVVQLGMACVQVAIARMWSAWGVSPVVVVGHSLGEYAALHVAGVLSVSDMIFLVGRRAQLLESDCTANTHGMLAVKANIDTLSNTLGSDMIEVACVNGPEETVLCGTIAVIESTSSILTTRGIKSTKLNVSFAFHSSQVDPILAAFKQAASSVVFNKPSIPLLSPLTGSVIREAGTVCPEYLVRHARETVNMWAALDEGSNVKLVDEKTAWLEIGAHPVCSGMVKSSLGGSPVAAASLRRNEDPWNTIANSIATLFLAGVPFDFNEYHREFNDAHQLLTLPTYSFDQKKYWLDYHNNWTLTKGESLKSIDLKPAPIVETKSKLSTTSCQRIVHEELHANTGTVVIQSDLAEPKLHKAVSGHLVNDSALCPSSLYADMGLTVADYLYKQLRPGAPEVAYNLCKMEVPKPLIATLPPPPEGQHIQLEATADLELRQVQLKFRSVTPHGKVLVEHAHATVRYEDPENWRDEWRRTQYMVQTQIDILHQKLQSGGASKILRGMAYKLFKALVDYQPAYQGMEEVILDGKETEATASIRFQTTPDDGTFYCSPYWIDSLAHISGFIVNASDVVNSADSVYISHGWKEVKISKPLSADKQYRSYVRMQPAPGNVRVGDVYILEGKDIIGMVTGLKFQEIPRRVLNIMMPPAKKAIGRPTPAPIEAPVSAVTIPKITTKQIIKQRPNQEKRQQAKNVKAVVAKQAGSIISSRVMSIISEETDVDMSELVDDAAFENLGVDSLMSLTISAKFREDLNMDISSTLFTDYPTVGAMKQFFAQFDGGVPLPEQSDSEDDDSVPSDNLETPCDDGLSETPPSSVPSSVASDAGKDIQGKGEAIHLEVNVNPAGLPSLARKIVAEEMGVSVSEISDKADLSEMGMDSLMSLTILSSLREHTGQEIPSEFLVANTTIEDIENALGLRPKAIAEVRLTSTKPHVKPKRPSLAVVNKKLQVRNIAMYPPATSVLLQGNAKIATKKLFLLPDGSGSATSYVSIPKISPDVAVYGLNCPFMKTPTDFTCGIETVAAIYVAEMRRRQPSGPYIIGGWSAGGVIAYEVGMQLINQGQVVDRLVLIDSPCPVRLDPLPARLHVFFDSIGLLGTGKPGGTPGWLLPHFSASIQALKEYEPAPMDPKKAPKVCAIWCTDGVCKPGDPRPPPGEGEDPAPMTWLLNDRTDFGHNGWAQLMPEENFECAVMGGNHFTMMKDDHAKTLGRLIQKGLGIQV